MKNVTMIEENVNNRKMNEKKKSVRLKRHIPEYGDVLLRSQSLSKSAKPDDASKLSYQDPPEKKSVPKQAFCHTGDRCHGPGYQCSNE